MLVSWRMEVFQFPLDAESSSFLMTAWFQEEGDSKHRDHLLSLHKSSKKKMDAGQGSCIGAGKVKNAGEDRDEEKFLRLKSMS